MVELKKLPKGILSGLYQKKTGSMLSDKRILTYTAI